MNKYILAKLRPHKSRFKINSYAPYPSLSGKEGTLMYYVENVSFPFNILLDDEEEPLLFANSEVELIKL